MSREKLPSRRKNWTQKVRIDGQTFYLTVGEYDDGRPGEVFLSANKVGSMIRGMLDDYARSISLQLQEGIPVETVLKHMKLSNYPPHGDVIGEGTVATYATSVTDWVSQEVSAVYCSGMVSGQILNMRRVRPVGENNVAG